MFLTPKYGWTYLQLGDYTDRASYLTDVPNDCFEAFINFFKTENPQTILFDAEGWSWYLILDSYYTTIVSFKSGSLNKAEAYVHWIDIEDLAEEFINDIKSDYDGWQNWMSFDDELDDFYQDIKELEKCIMHYKNKRRGVRIK